jgi:hypothetical protein
MEKQHLNADVIKHPTARVLFLCPVFADGQVAVIGYILTLPETLHGLIPGRY